jgi:hypothetical protein
LQTIAGCSRVGESSVDSVSSGSQCAVTPVDVTKRFSLNAVVATREI